MNIQWLGESCLLLESRATRVLITAGSTLPDGVRDEKADILLFGSASELPSTDVGAEGAFVIDRPGEYEVQGAFVVALQALEAGPEGEPRPCQVFCVDLDGATVCHVGRLGGKLSREQVEALGEVQLLALPLDGMSPALAAEVVAQIEPALVLPLGPGAGDERPTGAVAKFLEEMGAEVEAPEPSLRLEPARLPEEPTVVRLEARA